MTCISSVDHGVMAGWSREASAMERCSIFDGGGDSHGI